MTKLLKYIRDNLKIISVIFYFIVASVVISFMLPKQAKFRYEFQKGRPWIHQDLQAEFDFPIYKSANQISRERDSVLRDFMPYFRIEQNIRDNKIQVFRQNFQRNWTDYSVNKFKINEESYKSSTYTGLRNLGKYFEDSIAAFLSIVYNNGIIDIRQSEEETDMNLSMILLVRNNIADEVNISALFTPRTAYEYLKRNINEIYQENTSKNVKNYREFFDSFDVNQFIQVNVTYDKGKSDAVRSELINKISTYRDKVQKGQRIISRGELVTNEKYQILESLKIEYESRLGFVASRLISFGKFILVCVSLFVIFLFLFNLRKEILFDRIKSIFILLLFVIMIFVASTTVKSDRINFYIIPFVIVPIILRTFYDERLALFIHFISTILLGLLAPNSFEFVFVTFVSGIIAVFSLTNFYRRSRIVYTAIMVFLSYSITYFGISIVQEGNVNNIDFNNFKWFAINSLLLLLSFPLIYVFEKLFGFLSDATLMELADTNQPLLRELAEKAPGTFQHSLQVANLAEEVIRKIGGNPLLIRTGALYHDIGKMENPIFYIENQATGINPHDNLSFNDSARIIIKHVEKGVEIAKKHKLPPQIIDFIVTHHGTTTVQYFYRSYIKKYPEQAVDVREFMYPGPKPFSKETAVLMMADSIEAASRSLKDINDKSIEMLVDGIIEGQLASEQYNNADITFRDITEIREVLKLRLRNIYHYRISYPA